MESIYDVIPFFIIAIIILIGCFLSSYYRVHIEYDNLMCFDEFKGRDKKDVIWSQTKNNMVFCFVICIAFAIFLVIFGQCTSGCFSSHGNGYREMQYKEWRRNNPNA